MSAMLRGWGSPNNPFDDEDKSPESAKVPDVSNNNPSQTSVDYVPPPPPPVPDPGMFREWEAASRRYEEEKVEITAEDPLASPGNSSLNESISGWSVGAGMVDREGIDNPFDVEEYGEDGEDEDDGVDRSSSPREGHSARHSLSMVKEEEDEDANGANGNMFDDVDLEAFPKNLPTAHKNTNGGNSNIHSKIHSIISRRRSRGNITNRVLHELQTNPNLRFKVIAVLSVMLVASCLIAISVAASNGNKRPAVNQGEAAAVSAGSSILLIVSNATTTTPPEPTTSAPTTKSPSSSPSATPTTKPPTHVPSGSPTYAPTMYPTEELTTASPTSYPTIAVTTVIPSFSPTTDTPTYSPSWSPVTLSPTRDCTDALGDFMTYNDKERDCIWLDNDYNGAKSTRKDVNCLDSELGETCKYTCRLYNGCMEYLLSSLPEYSNENDVSIGDSCADKEGSFMSNGNVPRECIWLEEDVNTAPMKKNVNCGTPDVPRTELGIMCPGSCAGYNDCTVSGRISGVDVVGGDGGDSDIEKVSPHPLSGANNDEAEDGTTEVKQDKPPPTPFPTYDEAEDHTPFPTFWSSATPTTLEERCQDKDGEFMTHMGKLRQCRWFHRDDVEEKKLLNCGITEIGLNCMESCPCNNELLVERGGESNITLADIITEGVTTEEDGPTSIPTFIPTAAPTPHPASKGLFDESGDVLTLTALADASVSQKEEDENFGDSKRLNVANNPDDDSERQRQSLLLFDLTFVAKSFGPVIARATLSMYSVTGSEWGGVTLKKMSDANWTEDGVTWSNVPGGDGLDEPVVSYVDSLDGNTWYDIDVTAAVKDALENGEPHLGIRIVSEDKADVYFGSREREKEPPRLIIDSRTTEPTSQPTDLPTFVPTTYMPTFTPTSSPTIALDCMDKRGKFTTHTEESEPCSWLDVGNGSLKKAFNCQDQTEAALFCQAQCSAYNGCDDLNCEDKVGAYSSHTGWTAECSWLSTGQGTLKLEQNCGTNEYPITELGKRCQATCGDYNGCSAV